MQPSMFALFSPPHYTLPSLSSCSLFHLRQSPDRAGSHRRCAAHPQRATSHTSHLPPHTKLNSPPSPPLILPLTQHLLLVAPGRCKMLERLGNKARGRGWSAMTVPQHNLFYLTPANASEPTGGHRGAQRTHSPPSSTIDRINDDRK